MRHVERPDASRELAGQLSDQTGRIPTVGTVAARYAVSSANWANAGKVRLMRELIAMNRGHNRCMYCEYSEAGTVDHFCPSNRAPNQTFRWTNLHLACQPCQNAKGTTYSNRLLKPTAKAYRPWNHLAFEPTTGEYVELDARATESAQVFAWGRGKLPEYRWKSFMVFQAAIIVFGDAMGAGDVRLADEQRRLAAAESHPGILDWICHWVDAGDPDGHLDARVIRSVTNYPEIRKWC